MSNHLPFDDQTPGGRKLRRMLNKGEESDDEHADVRSLMITQRNGDGSSDDHYDEVRAYFGFATNAKARAAFEEIDSAYSKISGNGSVSNVRAARDQLFDRLRG